MENIAFYSDQIYKAYLLGKVPFDKITRSILAEFSKIIIFEEEAFYLTQEEMIDIIQNGRLKNSVTPLFLSFDYKTLMPVLSYDLISQYTHLCDQAEKYGNPEKIIFDFSNLIFLQGEEENFNSSFFSHGTCFLKSYLSDSVYLAAIFQNEKTYQSQLLTNLARFTVKKNRELVKIFSAPQPQLYLLNLVPSNLLPTKLDELTKFEADIFSDAWNEMHEILGAILENYTSLKTSKLIWNRDNLTLQIPEDNGEFSYRLTYKQFLAFERLYQLRDKKVNRLKSSDIREGKLELSNLFKKEDALILKQRYLEIDGKYWSCRKSPKPLP